MPSLMDEFDGSELDLSEIPGFEALYASAETADETPGGDEAPDDDAPVAPAPQAVTRAEYETLQTQLRETMDALRAERARPPAPVYVNAPVPQQDPAAVKAAIEAEYYKDPVGTSQRMAQFAAQQQFGPGLALMRETLAQQSVQSYKQNLMQDPQFAAAASKHFDEQVARVNPKALANLEPAQLTEFLNLAEEAAWGRVMKQVRTNSKKAGNGTSNTRQLAPAYGGASRGGGTGARPAAGTNAQEAALAKAFGLTQADFDGIIE